MNCKKLIFFMILIVSLTLQGAFGVFKKVGKTILGVPSVTGAVMYGQSDPAYRKDFALHESAHAVAFQYLDCNAYFLYAHASNFFGIVFTDNFNPFSSSTEQCKNCIIAALAGDLVKHADQKFKSRKNLIVDELGLPRHVSEQVIDFYSYNAGRDLSSAYQIAYHIASDKLGIIPKQVEQVQDEILEECFARAKIFIDAHAHNIEAISEELMKKKPLPMSFEVLRNMNTSVNKIIENASIANEYCLSEHEIRKIIKANSKK